MDCCSSPARDRSIAAHARALGSRSLAARLERVEVVAVADVDERLAPVVHLLEVAHDVVGRRERDVRAIADFGRPLAAVRRVEDVLRAQAGAGDLFDRLIQPLPVVRHVDGQRRGAGRHDAEHVAVVNQVFRNLLEQLADASGVAEVQVQVVDEDQENAPGRVARRAATAAG